MGDVRAYSINLLFQTRPRLDRLTFDFVSNESRLSTRHCPYSLVPLCNGSVARLIEDPAFNSNLVQSWLEDCDSSHHCVNMRQAGDSRFELRVIDVQDLCVVKAPEACRYTALSYVWGNVQQPLLKTDNMELFSIPESLRSIPIPQTIKDAMHVCRLLKLRYLWVDSLCIVQDSKGHAAGQIAHMHNIYREAYLTIVVAAGLDCASGIPSIQDRPPFPPAVVIDGVKFAIVPHSFDAIEQRVQQSVWNQRSWTMQESALSRRRLVFTAQEYFLSCDRGLYVEALAGKLLQPHRSSIPPLPKLVPGQLATAADGRRADLSYGRLVSLYVNRKLTYPEDILRAFEGMANALTPLLGPFRWGHPHRLFRYAMCWCNYAQLKRRPGFPSWSWTGWHHPYVQEHGSSSAVRLSTWPFLFPSFGVTEMWPHCLVNVWQDSTSMRSFSHIYGSPERLWPSKPDFDVPFPQYMNSILDWMEDDGNVETRSGHDYFDAARSKAQPEAFARLTDINMNHVITFRTAIATFKNTFFPPKSNSQTLRSYVMDIDLLEPRFHATRTYTPEHQVPAHEEAGGLIAATKLNLIFLGQLKQYVVVLPVHIDILSSLGDSKIQEIVARRQGNPFRMFNDMWYGEARKCIVHLW
ncbi:Nn.00g113160.m01.CDS01 [Neocucurbitaria sp. VM-36]